MRRQLRLRKPSAEYYVAGWVLILSFLPLLYGIFTPHSWVGYVEGNYVFDNGRLRLDWAQVAIGGDKPLIEAYPSNSAGSSPVNLVEVSDDTSYVNGFELFNTRFSTQTVNGTTLTTSYSTSNFTVVKVVTIAKSQVFVTYSSSRPVHYDIAFWHSYYDSVDGVTLKQFKGPTCISNPPSDRVSANFTMASYGQQLLSGHFVVSGNPISSFAVCRDEIGINKIVLSATARSVSFAINGSVGGSGDASPLSQLLSYLGGSFAFELAFPLVAVVGIFIWKRQSR
jgi:hypothetical protein